ncbi:MAG: hypothetical protein DRR08_26365 [Candidatus Parabeggiatoa sp. nov. 2]|nr:MAG: hypothetical protein B6247_02390 [Beggiatoa sp. 4572_84]RKZ54516.1 MAG: hypothetical protein DRR08_26365 [Gammaproteobacteria bacterium]
MAIGRWFGGHKTVFNIQIKVRPHNIHHYLWLLATGLGAIKPFLINQSTALQPTRIGYKLQPFFFMAIGRWFGGHKTVFNIQIKVRPHNL